MSPVTRYSWPSGRWEEAVYVQGVKQGEGVEVAEGGDRETRVWVDGVMEGPARCHTPFIDFINLRKSSNKN